MCHAVMEHIQELPLPFCTELAFRLRAVCIHRPHSSERTMNLKRFQAFIFQMCVFLVLFLENILGMAIYFLLPELKTNKQINKQSKIQSSMATTWARKDVVTEERRQGLLW